MICIYKSSLIRRESCQNQRDPPQPHRNEAHAINTVSMAATSTETTQGNANTTNVSNTLASYSTGVNPMAPPNNQSSMEPTTVPMLEESPIPPDSVGPSNQLPVYADGMLNDASQMY